MLHVTVLGCGTSGGVPQLISGYGACDPNERRNRRRRSSILIRKGGKTLLIDTSPDLREQLLDEGTTNIDALLYTHAHADHVHGIDDLRWFCAKRSTPIPVYGDEDTLAMLKTRFDYAFVGGIIRGKEEAVDKINEPMLFGGKPVLQGHLVEDGNCYDIAGMRVEIMRQNHGFSDSIGFRIGGFAYSTDVVRFSDSNYEYLKGVSTWIVDCLRYRSHPTHLNFEEMLEAVERVGVSRVYLTHMNNDMDYATLCRLLPSHIRPAYDGLCLEA